MHHLEVDKNYMTVSIQALRHGGLWLSTFWTCLWTFIPHKSFNIYHLYACYCETEALLQVQDHGKLGAWLLRHINEYRYYLVLHILMFVHIHILSLWKLWWGATQNLQWTLCLQEIKICPKLYSNIIKAFVYFFRFSKDSSVPVIWIFLILAFTPLHNYNKFATKSINTVE